MPSDRPLDRLREIVANCDSILGYTAGMDFEGYASGPQMVRDAVERCFQRISEAACKLGRYLDDLAIWYGISEDVPKLRQAALAEIRRQEGRP